MESTTESFHAVSCIIITAKCKTKISINIKAISGIGICVFLKFYYNTAVFIFFYCPEDSNQLISTG